MLCDLAGMVRIDILFPNQTDLGTTFSRQILFQKKSTSVGFFDSSVAASRFGKVSQACGRRPQMMVIVVLIVAGVTISDEGTIVSTLIQ